MTDDSFGAKLRRLRMERGLSLRQLAAASGVNFGHLSKIENGRRPSTASIAHAVDRALNADGVLITLDLLERAERRAPDVPSDPMRRRTAMAGAFAATVAGLFPTETEATKPYGRVSMADAEWLESTVGRLYRLDSAHGGDTLWQGAVSLAKNGHRMLETGTYGDAVEEALLRATGRMQLCAGWLAFDASQHDAARTCFTEGLALARQAEDPEVESSALADLANQANIMGQPRQARRLGEAAEAVADRLSGFARLAIIPQFRLAVAYARLGDAMASDQAIRKARNLYDRDVDKTPADWCSFISPAELDGIEGTCAIDLGRGERAVTLIGNAIAGYGEGYDRNRVMYRVRMARALLITGDIEAAAVAGHTALDDLAGDVSCGRALRELRMVAQTLTPHRGVPAAVSFVHRYTRPQEYQP